MHYAGRGRKQHRCPDLCSGSRRASVIQTFPKPGALVTFGKARTLAASLRGIQNLHQQYVAQLKERVISDLRRLPPASFETFSKELLEVYGFEDTHVTQVSGDGGIDGYGKLKVGLAHLNVAFQCKRWTRGNIQRTESDKFRGAAQGDFEQGIFSQQRRSPKGRSTLQ